MSQRLRPLLYSLLFLMASVGAYHTGTAYLAPSTTCTATIAESTPAGTWQQYVMYDGKPVYLGTFTYQPVNGDYEIKADDVAPVTLPQSDFHTFAHHFDGNRWTFHSDWHEYGVAWFELNKVDEDRFEGYAYLEGERLPNRHILIKVSD